MHWEPHYYFKRTHRENTHTLTHIHTHMNIGSECVPMIKCAALRIRNISFAMHLPMRIRPVSLLLIAHRHRPLWLHLCIDFCIDSTLTNGRILLRYAQCTCLDSALSCGRKYVRVYATYSFILHHSSVNKLTTFTVSVCQRIIYVLRKNVD